MEFDELKKIWDTQDNKPMYTINEPALHKHILTKKKQGYHITNISELLSIFTHIAGGAFVLMMYVMKEVGNIYMYLLPAWMLATGFYTLYRRINRIKAGHRYDRSIRGDLDQAIDVATYQVRLSQFLSWNVIPITLFTTLSVWQAQKAFWLVPCLLGFFIISFFASRWEHKIYKSKKDELLALKNKLEREAPDESGS
jgi:hypothetical protein